MTNRMTASATAGLSDVEIRRFERLRTVLGVLVAIQVIGLLFSIALSSIAFVGAAAVFGFMAWVRPREAFRANGLEWFILAFIGASALSVSFAVHPMESLTDARRVLLYTLVYLIPLAFSSDRALRRFVLALAVVSALQSAIEIGVYFAGARDRLGAFQHYMTAAGIKMLVVLIVLPRALEHSTPVRERLLIGSASAVIVFALVLTQTRSSWIGFAAGMIVIGIAAYRSALPLLLALAVAFALLAPGGIMERVTNMFATRQGAVQTSTVASNQYRLRMWRTGWRMFLSDPLTGVGEGRMYQMYRTWVPDADKDEGGHLHNSFIHILATHGAPGLLAMLALFVAVIHTEWRSFRRTGRNPRGALALGALAATTGFLVNGMAEYNFGDHEVMVLVWTALGLALTVRARADVERAPGAAGT